MASVPSGTLMLMAGGSQARVKFHVLLTTYDMVPREASELRRMSWAALVVDEGHRLRNRHSQSFQAGPSLAAVHQAAVPRVRQAAGFLQGDVLEVDEGHRLRKRPVLSG